MLQTVFSKLFSWIWNILFWFKFHWTLFLTVQWTISHWFKWWLGTEQVPGHYLSKLWYGLLMHRCVHCTGWVNTLRPRQDGCHFPDDFFKCIFLNENALISIKISLRFVPKGPINTIPALVQIMAWRRPGDKPLSEPMMVKLPTHICVTRPQWVKSLAI